MTEYRDGDSQYIRGRIDGYLHGVARHTDQDTSFDPERWQELSGDRVVYNSVPAWPSAEARDRGDDAVVLCAWDDATETETLKPDASLPSDRPGALVFADGTTVLVRYGDPSMFSLDADETARIERLDDLALEMLRSTAEVSQQRTA